MKRIAMLAGFVLLGNAAAAGIYALLAAILDAYRSRSGASPESYMGVAFAILLPAALFPGGLLTGYLSRPHLRTRLGALAVSFGVYPCVFMTAVNLVMVYIVKDSPPLPFPDNALLFGTFLSWALASWAGVELGCSARARKDAAQGTAHPDGSPEPP